MGWGLVRVSPSPLTPLPAGRGEPVTQPTEVCRTLRLSDMAKTGIVERVLTAAAAAVVGLGAAFGLGFASDFASLQDLASSDEDMASVRACSLRTSAIENSFKRQITSVEISSARVQAAPPSIP